MSKIFEGFERTVKMAEEFRSFMGNIDEELKDEIAKKPAGDQKVYRENTSAMYAAIKRGDLDTAQKLALQSQKKINNILRNEAKKSK